MKQKRPKAMFSLKKGSGSGGDNLVRRWRALARANTGLSELKRLVLLAVDGLGVNEEDPEGPPLGFTDETFTARVNAFRQHLVDAGELGAISPLMDKFEDLAPYAEALRARFPLLANECVNLRPLPPAITRLLEELFEAAWETVTKELPGTLRERIERAGPMAYLTVIGSADLDDDIHRSFMDATHQNFCTWLYKNAARLLTPDETRELASMAVSLPPPA